jgi:hypothetical protein
MELFATKMSCYVGSVLSIMYRRGILCTLHTGIAVELRSVWGGEEGRAPSPSHPHQSKFRSSRGGRGEGLFAPPGTT